jgi:hypothetical protein
MRSRRPTGVIMKSLLKSAVGAGVAVALFAAGGASAADLKYTPGEGGFSW